MSHKLRVITFRVTIVMLLVCAILFGLNIYRECTGVNTDFVHYTIYTVSATIGVVTAIAAFYNIYATNYSIRKWTLLSSDGVVRINFWFR